MSHQQLKNIRIALIGPTGTGKTTLADMTMNTFSRMYLSKSHSTKPIPDGHENGHEYNYITQEEFDANVSAGLYAEYNQHFNASYATPHSECDITNHSVIFNVDVNGAMELKKKFPDLITVFIKPPSVYELKQRLIIRNRESIEKIESRIKRYKYEKTLISQFDYCIVNKDLNACFAKLAGIIFKARGGVMFAIDGTAASGKGSIAKRIAAQVGGYHLDSGLIYRSITNEMLNQGLLPKDTNQLPEYLSAFLDSFDGVQNETELRTERINQHVADFAALEIVRNSAFKLQMRAAYYFDHPVVVAEGRDMTYHVFVYADYKFFVDCALSLRAQRRAAEYGYQANSVEYWNVYNSLENRDATDRSRPLHPLKYCPYLGVKKLNNTPPLEVTLQKVKNIATMIFAA